MIGIDTNVLVRFLVRDDESQFRRALGLVRRAAQQGEDVFVSQLVLMETEWVLRSRYGVDRIEFGEVLSELLESADLVIEDESVVEAALDVWRNSSAEFADCLIGMRNLALGCRTTATFDQRAMRLPAFIAVS